MNHGVRSSTDGARTSRQDLGGLLERSPESTVDVIDSIALLLASEKLLLVSDGGVKDEEGLFGWVINTVKTIRVMEEAELLAFP